MTIPNSYYSGARSTYLSVLPIDPKETHLFISALNEIIVDCSEECRIKNQAATAVVAMLLHPFLDD